MDAVITAGGIPDPGEPLYKYTQGKPKALLEFRGKPLAQHVLDALGAAERIQRIVLVGLEQESGLTSAKPLTFLPNQGAMLDNIRAGMHKVLELHPQAEYIFLGSSDAPTLKGELIDWAIDQAMQTRLDGYYYVLTRETFERRYPGCRRKYLKARDGQLTGGTVGILSTGLVASRDDLWDRLIAARKSTYRGAMLFGPWNLLKVLLRRATVQDAERAFRERVGISGRMIPCPYAELAYDVDEDQDYEYLLQHPEAVD